MAITIAIRAANIQRCRPCDSHGIVGARDAHLRAPLASPEADQQRTLSRSQAATRLKISMGSVDKLISAGILDSPPLQAAVVEQFAARPTLAVKSGALTVLRTAPRSPAYPGEGREFIGYHVDMTDEQLAAASLGYWRSDPDKVVGNELFAVTVASFPVAVFRITEKVKTMTRDSEDARVTSTPATCSRGSDTEPRSSRARRCPATFASAFASSCTAGSSPRAAVRSPTSVPRSRTPARSQVRRRERRASRVKTIRRMFVGQRPTLVVGDSIGPAMPSPTWLNALDDLADTPDWLKCTVVLVVLAVWATIRLGAAFHTPTNRRVARLSRRGMRRRER